MIKPSIAIAAFERAHRDYVLKGSYSPEERDDVEERYRLARLSLIRYIRTHKPKDVL